MEFNLTPDNPKHAANIDAYIQRIEEHPPPDPPEDDFESRVRRAMDRERVRDEARRRLRAEQDGQERPFDAGTLADILSRPPEPTMRIDGLVPWEAGVLLVAQRKTGKTTLAANYARSLLTGEDFLGQFEVRRVDGDIGFLNFEVSGGQLARWLNEVGVPDTRCHLVNLRGRRNPLTHPEDRERLAEHLRSRGIEALVVDPFGRAFTGASQNDAGEVGGFLLDLDMFVRSEVGARDLLMTAHAGWNGERSRGSSALEDWADVFWTLTRDQTDGQDRPRFFRAEGRDVDVDEDQLVYDTSTRRLTMAGVGSRRQTSSQRVDSVSRQRVMELLEKYPEGMSGKDLAEAVGRKDSAFTQLRNSMVEEGVIEQEERPGRGGGKLYRLPDPNLPNMPEPADAAPSEPTEPLSIEGGSGSVGMDGNIPTSNSGDSAR